MLVVAWRGVVLVVSLVGRWRGVVLVVAWRSVRRGVAWRVRGVVGRAVLFDFTSSTALRPFVRAF